ncbi:MAG: aspartate/glutamate racemase family protein [Acidimicrobiales bacterium]
MAPAYDIGILTGSGPDAGIDMWAAILDRWRTALGDRYTGDADAPAVLVHSVPQLGASMDLARHVEALRAIILDHAAELDRTCRAWVIACNTLNWFEPAIREANPSTTFVSFRSVVEALVRAQPPASSVLLGARPVAELGPWSPYAALAPAVIAPDERILAETHRLIVDVKRIGACAELTSRLDTLCRNLPATQVLLACTELPLIAGDDRRCVDVTRAVAAHVVDRTLRHRRLRA